MAKGIKLAAPPPRPAQTAEPAPAATEAEAPRRQASHTGGKFDQVREGAMVQFNKRIPQHVADAFEMLAIKTRRRVPELLAEAAELLQERHGKV